MVRAKSQGDSEDKLALQIFRTSEYADIDEIWDLNDGRISNDIDDELWSLVDDAMEMFDKSGLSRKKY